MNIAIAIAQALISGIPKLVDAIKAGKDPKDIKLGDFMSSDALEKIRGANKKADDFIQHG